MKKNIKNSNNKAIDIIKKIKHRQFDWKINNNHQNIGYVAQELEKIDKNFIFKTPNFKNGKVDGDLHNINILPILATSTKAIQEQQEEIEELRQRINQLERKNSNGKDSI